MEGRRLAIVQTRREGEIRKERKIGGGRYGFGRLNEGWMKKARSSRKDPLFIFFFGRYGEDSDGTSTAAG